MGSRPALLPRAALGGSVWPGRAAAPGTTTQCLGHWPQRPRVCGRHRVVRPHRHSPECPDEVATNEEGSLGLPAMLALWGGGSALVSVSPEEPPTWG